jgi:hypothetical protein
MDIVCADDADVTLRLSDEVVIQSALYAHSEIFGVADIILPGNSLVNEVVTLDKPSAVLDLFLQYMYTKYRPILTRRERHWPEAAETSKFLGPLGL